MSLHLISPWDKPLSSGVLDHAVRIISNILFFLSLKRGMKPKYLRHSYQPMCNPLNKIFLGILSIYNLQVVTGFCVFVCMKTLDSVPSSLGRYVFGSEMSYNKHPPPAWASLLNSPKSQKIVGH